MSDFQLFEEFQKMINILLHHCCIAVKMWTKINSGLLSTFICDYIKDANTEFSIVFWKYYSTFLHKLKLQKCQSNWNKLAVWLDAVFLKNIWTLKLTCVLIVNRNVFHSLYIHLNISLDCVVSGWTKLILISSNLDSVHLTSLALCKSASSVNHAAAMPIAQVACRI